MNLKEMKDRLAAIAVESKAATGEALEKLMKEAKELNASIAEAEARSELAKMAKAVASSGEVEKTGENDAAKRGAQLKNKMAATYNARAIITPMAAMHTTTEEVLPQHTANGVNGTFNQLSSILTAVRHVYLPGGESYTRGFVKDYGTGAYTDEAAAYADVQTVFGKTTITKTKITAYAEESEEFLKLADADYDSEVRYGVGLAVRKKLAAEILLGDGATGHLKGIFYNPTDEIVIDPDTDLEISEITNTTLDEIIYEYGGEENVEDLAVLVLNKRDLKAFALLRASDGRKLHDIKCNGNYGTIDNTPFIISSSCKAISSPTTEEGDYAMSYGPLSNYEMAVFSDMTVKRDESYKFAEGLIANRASAFMGGGVTVWNGFKRVKKGA